MPISLAPAADTTPKEPPMNNPLTDVIPTRARKYVYALLSLAALVLAGYQATNGDWTQFAIYIVGALTGATAASNIQSRDTQWGG